METVNKSPKAPSFGPSGDLCLPSPTFIGRRTELQDLRELHRQPGCHIAVVYGRRRVGKTSLVNHAYAGEPLLSLEGLENKGKQQQIRNFIFQLEQQTQTRVERKNSIRC